MIDDKRVPVEPIAIFLKNKCGEDEEFAGQVMQEHKFMDKCLDFVYQQARKYLNGVSGWIDDNEVYMMAVNYFRLDDLELERKQVKERAKQKLASAKVAEGQISLFSGDAV